MQISRQIARKLLVWIHGCFIIHISGFWTYCWGGSERNCQNVRKLYRLIYQSSSSPMFSIVHVHMHRIHTVHDEVKDKSFVLEMSWVTEGLWTSSLHFLVNFVHFNIMIHNNYWSNMLSQFLCKMYSYKWKASVGSKRYYWSCRKACTGLEFIFPSYTNSSPIIWESSIH